MVIRCFCIDTLSIWMILASCCCVFADLEFGSVGFQYWPLNGSEDDIGYNNASEFIIGRCSESKSLSFKKSNSSVTAPCSDLSGESFTYSFWLKFAPKGFNPTFYADMRGPKHGFYLFVKDQVIRVTVILDTDYQELLKSNVKIAHNTWAHFAVTYIKEKGDIILYINGKKQKYASLWQGINYFLNSGTPRCTIGNMPTPRVSTKYQLYGSVMDLYILNTSVSDDNVDSLRGFPVIDQNESQVKGSVVLLKWTPPIQGQCQVHAYSIYFRKMSVPRWTSIMPPKNITKYILQLGCRTTYQIAVTAWSTNGETSLKDSKLWRVTTGGDKPATPVITNLETSTCIVNLTWSANEDAACPLTEYTIYYRQTEIEESSWNKIDIKTVSKTNHEWSLRCYTQYEFAVSAWNDMGQSNLSATRQIKTSVKQGTTVWTITGITLGSISVFIVISVVLRCHRRKRNRIRNNARKKWSKSDITPLQHLEVWPEQVTLLEELGRGAFGKVHKGVLRESPGVEVFYRNIREKRVQFKEGRTIAVKVLSALANEQDKQQFLEEIDLMKQIGCHAHVLNMIGFWTRSEPFLLLLEYVPHGDLLNWLREKRNQSSETQGGRCR